MASEKIAVEKVERPELVKDGKCLDLAFAMDCTGSMGSYINSARDNIRKIVEEIVASEKSDVRLALVEYRDHPPQCRSFVTRAHDFTASLKTMKKWLNNCSASGGGDTPEAVADALHDILKLSWRKNATKICVCISDAPPHGLNCVGDGFPNGCPAGIDPMTVSHQLAEKGVTIYMVGCEPSITPYKEFFMAVAHITGGQYVPLTHAQLLTKVIIGGAQEEISLEQYMSEVDEEIQVEVTAGREIDEDEFAQRVHQKLQSQGVITWQLQRNQASLRGAPSSPMAKKLSHMNSMSEVKKNFKPTTGLPIPPLPVAPQMSMMSAVACGGATPALPMQMMSGGVRHVGFLPAGALPPTSSGMIGPSPLMCNAVPDLENYNTVLQGISYEQSARMVQKSMARNCAKKKRLV